MLALDNFFAKASEFKMENDSYTILKQAEILIILHKIPGKCLVYSNLQ